jgi:sRNA-binding protein
VAGSLSSSNYPPQKAAVFDVLTLKAILWSKAHPMATINNHTFEVGDTSKVKLGSSNVTVTCISIREDAVQIKVADSPEVRELRVRAK